jgi:hypothetical protein
MRFRLSNHARKAAITVVMISSLVFTPKAYSQDYQAWIDGFIYKSFGNSLLNEVNIGYNKLVQKDGWSDYYIANTLSFNPFGWYVAEGSAELHYTADPQVQNMTEVRFYIGQEFSVPRFFEKIHLQNPYFYFRVEQRFLNYLEDGTSEEKTRVRMRLGCRFLLNNTTLSSGTYYIPFYLENFVNLNGEATERFSSRNRFVLGFGYIFNYRWRGEFYYYGQRSRNTVEDSFVKSDNIFQIRIKYFLK